MGFDGFDSMELLMDLEDRLGIAIISESSAVLERIRTPGELHEYLTTRLDAAPSPAGVRCRSAAAFYRGRRRLAAQFGADHRMLRPSTPINALLSPDSCVTERSGEWARIEHSLGLRLPKLEHPIWIQRMAVGLVVLSFISCLFLSPRPATTIWSFVGSLVLLMGVTIGLPFLLLVGTRRRFAFRVPSQYETVGSVISCTLLNNLPEVPQSDCWTRHELWELIRDLTAKSANCPPATIHRDSSWGAL